MLANGFHWFIERVMSACGSYINCDLLLFVQTQNSSYYMKSQSTVVNLRSDIHCGSVHDWRLSVAVVHESVKYDIFYLSMGEVRNKTVLFNHQQMHYLLNLERFKICTHRSYMFRSSTIIRELVLSLAKVMLKLSVK
jgi:hypothetical protein